MRSRNSDAIIHSEPTACGITRPIRPTCSISQALIVFVIVTGPEIYTDRKINLRSICMKPTILRIRCSISSIIMKTDRLPLPDMPRRGYTPRIRSSTKTEIHPHGSRMRMAIPFWIAAILAKATLRIHIMSTIPVLTASSG